ncbi:MAG: ClbS/DfsB family four-helix bundle protein [Thermomicrobiales bacterium]
MTQLNDRDALLKAVRSLRDDIERVVTEAGEVGETRPDSADEWTCKDLIAHLTSWRLTTVARLEAGLRGEEPAMPWPAPLDEDGDLDEINHWFFETNRDKPFAEIVRESRETIARVERAIAALPERDLLEPDRFPWLAGYALGPAVVHGTLEHYREHEPDLRAWLARG